jgi:hypothetical protein
MKFRFFISIFFLCLLMISSRDFSDWLKLPKAIEHFAHHNQEENLSFAAFFKMHYLDDVKVDEDYEQDMELPFKSDSGSLQSLLSSVLIPSNGAYFFEENMDEFLSSDSRYFSPAIPDSYLGAIWQPPKKA